MSANERQVAGNHYVAPIQHWDYVVANDLDYFQGQITKYVTRWKKKNGLVDLEKAKHFLDKYIEVARKHAAADKMRHGILRVATEDSGVPGRGYVDQS